MLFFKKIRLKVDALIGIDDEYRFTATNTDSNGTKADLWILISESMMSTFKIPKYHSKESTDYLKKHLVNMKLLENFMTSTNMFTTNYLI